MSNIGTKAFDEKYHKEKLVQYVCESWLSGLEMDYESWMDNNGRPIRIIHLGDNEKSIVIKLEDFNNIIVPEAKRRFDEFFKGLMGYDNSTGNRK